MEMKVKRPQPLLDSDTGKISFRSRMLIALFALWACLVLLFCLLRVLLGLALVIISMPLNLFCKAIGRQGYYTNNDGNVVYDYFRNPFRKPTR